MGTGVDIAVVGSGAAGLMAAIQAGRAARAAGRRPRIVALDGARKPGAKILVAGGGRCNVTHDHVDSAAYAGSSPRAIRKVLLQFDVPATVAFFRDLGVELKREETGKLFPVTDRARTVLEALLAAARDAGVELLHPWRVEGLERTADGFLLRRGEGGHGRDRDSHAPDPVPGSLEARTVILATGGKSLPKSGSDGLGFTFVKGLGHRVIEPLLPALVPLVLEAGHFLRGLSGITFPAGVELRSASGKRLLRYEDSTLCTHFGLSGPSIMDISRHYLRARLEDPGAYLLLDLLPGRSPEETDRMLRETGKGPVLRRLTPLLPERLAREACTAGAGVDPSTPGGDLKREQRRALVRALHELRLPVAGDRGFNHAEVTAGGVPLDEIRLDTMESRLVPGLHLCGEICDVDGRIGGYNFQWAWASGTVAGRGAAGTGRTESRAGSRDD